jgi:hypothetical protein
MHSIHKDPNFCLKGAAVKVQVPYFVFDDRLKAYFKKTQEFVAQDPSRVCKTGDVVIIQKLEQQVRICTHSYSENCTAGSYLYSSVMKLEQQVRICTPTYSET